jgi:hypothetical protein
MIEVSLTGGGTPENPCLATSNPVMLRYEVESEGEPENDFEPMLSFYCGDHCLSTWVFTRALYESGRFDRAFAEQVVVAIEGWELEDGTVSGSLYAFTVLEPEPEWLLLGPEFRGPDNRRYPAQPCEELRDLLLRRLGGEPVEEVDRLLASDSTEHE